MTAKDLMKALEAAIEADPTVADLTVVTRGGFGIYVESVAVPVHYVGIGRLGARRLELHVTDKPHEKR